VSVLLPSSSLQTIPERKNDLVFLIIKCYGCHLKTITSKSETL